MVLLTTSASKTAISGLNSLFHFVVINLGFAMKLVDFCATRCWAWQDRHLRSESLPTRLFVVVFSCWFVQRYTLCHSIALFCLRVGEPDPDVRSPISTLIARLPPGLLWWSPLRWSRVLRRLCIDERRCLRQLAGDSSNKSSGNNKKGRTSSAGLPWTFGLQSKWTV